MTNTYLITGGMGCIGAWTINHLLKQGKQVVNFDLSDDRHRLNWLMSAEEQEAVTFVTGDLRDTAQVKQVIEGNNITHVIHLGALQVPMCRANPVLGAQVNVVGTLNIFEAVKDLDLKHVVYASSIAVYGATDEYPSGLVAHDAPRNPHTLYGTYKVANEDDARIYYQDYGITSTAFRPYTVYGIGRDQGLTSEPSKAIIAAAKGENYHITFGGQMQFHFASDVALQFIEAVENPLDGAYVFNMGQPAVDVAAFAQLLEKVVPEVSITNDDKALPFPIGFDPTELHSHFENVYEIDLEDGIRQTVEHARKLGDAI